MTVQQLYPTPEADADPLILYVNDDRPCPSDRPWVMVSMVASADGASEVGGSSAELGGEGDREVFRAVRACCDWIMVGAGTVSAERYTIPRHRPEVTRRRLESGRTPAARLAVLTTSGDLDPELPMLADRRPEEALPLIVTGANPSSDRVSHLSDSAEWVHVDTERPTPELVLAELHDRGARVVLAEGGPTLNGQLLDSGLIDELCLTISPHLVGGASPRIVSDASAATPKGLHLKRLLEHDGALFARYVRG